MDKMIRSDKAISETIGTLLLLGISISLFSVIYFSVVTIYPASATPSVNLICFVKENNITIEHRGGKILDLDSKIIVTINGTSYNFVVSDCLNESKANGVWNIGEKVVICPDEYLEGKKVSLSVIDSHSNSVIMLVKLQE